MKGKAGNRTKKAAAAGLPWPRRLRELLLGNRYILWAFIVPFVLMTAAFALMKVSPFGDKQILATDLWHQYYPFLADFQEKLKHGESLFWSWTQGGGVNYYALMSYYLAGPVNLLTVFIPAEWLREFLMFSVAARVGCAGMFMAVFLRSVYKRDDCSLVVFGMLFSFCAFFMGYYWNTIWLDAVCLTPLVALGTVKLLTENRFRLYTLTLTLSLLSNYYIGLFTCIFVLLIFAAYHVVKREGWGPFWRKLTRTAVFSMIAIGLTAFFLLPAYCALGLTHASGGMFPMKFAVNIGETNDLSGVLSALRQVLSNFLTFVPPSTAAAEALPNIACGTAALVFGLLYVTLREIDIRERAVSAGLILFLLLSCVIRQLDYIWHGFHFTNMVPYRFTYLVSFLLATMGFRAFTQLEKAGMRNIAAAAAGVAALVLLGIGVQERLALIGTAVTAAALCGLLLLRVRGLLSRQLFVALLTALVIGESGVTAYLGVKTTGVTSMEDYPMGGKDTAEVIRQMHDFEAETPELWRAEMTSTQTLNDGSLNGYNGLTMFSSMANESASLFYENFGLMGSRGGNRYGYAESTPVANTFMNLKYIISRDGSYSNTYDLKEVYACSDKKLLLNEHYIPMGFMVKDTLLDWTVETDRSKYDSFDKQNEFFRLATGVTEDVYTRLDVVSQGHRDHDKYPVYKKGDGKYAYDYSGAKEAEEPPKMKWNYEAAEDGIYCMYADIDGGEEVTILINDIEQKPAYSIKIPYIACIGRCQAGDKISITSELEKGTSGKATICISKFNTAVFERGYAAVSRDVMTTDGYTGSTMAGTIDVSESGLFYTSIPYEEGWRATVDGEPVEIEPVGESMLAFRLSDGTHSIRLTYYPKGFWAGCGVSAVCLAAFTAICIVRRRHTGSTETGAHQGAAPSDSTGPSPRSMGRQREH